MIHTRTDRLLIAALVVIVGGVYLTLATYNTYRFFEPELLGTVFDAQAESFIAGRVDVDRRHVGWEYYEVDGKTHVYWGPWPAVLRIPLLLAWPNTFGLWARLSCFVAAMLTVLAWAAAVYRRVGRRHPGLTMVVVLSIALGTPLVWLLSSSVVYHEPILWGMAGSAWCLLATLEFERRPSRGMAVTFALAFVVAYLSRSTYAFPWLIVTSRLAYLAMKKDERVPARARRRTLALLLFPVVAAVCLQAALNYARFGNPLSFIDLRTYSLAADPGRRAALEQYGYSNLARLPDTFKAYYLPHAAYFSLHFPFVRTAVVETSTPQTMFLSPDYTIALTVTSPWLFVFLPFGLYRLARSRSGSEWIASVSLFIQAAVSLTLWIIVLRYLVEALPFFIVMVIWALEDEDGLPRRFRGSWPCRTLVLSVCAFSIYASMASAIAWNAEPNRGSPPEYRALMQRHFADLDRRLARWLHVFMK